MLNVEHLKKTFGELEILMDIRCMFPTARSLPSSAPAGTGKTTLLR
jgi:ABC-type polar amino acid transport system ATPase subunit